MCIAAPGRILALDDGTAVVEVGGRRRRASLLMTPNVEIGAWVLVAAGNVVRRIDAAEEAGPLVPEQTMESLKEDVEWAKSQIG